MATFTQWINSYSVRQTELADSYFAHVRDVFKPALNAWIATTPLKNTAAQPTPFAMPEYQLEARAAAERLSAEAQGFAVQVRRNIQRASNYVLGVVLFASAPPVHATGMRRGDRSEPTLGAI